MSDSPSCRFRGSWVHVHCLASEERGRIRDTTTTTGPQGPSLDDVRAWLESAKDADGLLRRILASGDPLQLLERCGVRLRHLAYLLDSEPFVEPVARSIADRLHVRDKDRPFAEWLDERIDEQIEAIVARDRESAGASARGLATPHAFLTGTLGYEPDVAERVARAFNALDATTRRVFYELMIGERSIADCQAAGLGSTEEMFARVRLAMTATVNEPMSRRRKKRTAWAMVIEALVAKLSSIASTAAHFWSMWRSGGFMLRWRTATVALALGLAILSAVAFWNASPLQTFATTSANQSMNDDSMVSQAHAEAPLEGDVLREATHDSLKPTMPEPSRRRSHADGTVTPTLDAFTEELRQERVRAFEALSRGAVRSHRSAGVKVGETLYLNDWTLTRAATVSGTVRSEDGQRIAGAVVACIDEALTFADWEAHRRSSMLVLRGVGSTATTDEGGRFVLDEVPAGRRRLVATADRHLAAVSEPLDLRPSETLGGIELVMEPDEVDRRIKGWVSAPDGSPIRGARITLHSKSGDTIKDAANQEGMFDFRSLRRAAYDITASDPGGNLQELTREDVPTGTLDLRITLPEGRRVEVAVHSWQGVPVENFGVVAWDASLESVLWQQPTSKHPTGTTTIALPVKQFVLEVLAPGFSPSRTGPHDPERLPSRLEFKLDAERGVRGVVMGPDGPIPNATVALHASYLPFAKCGTAIFRMNRQPLSTTTASPDGHFVLPVRRPGRYFVRAQADGLAADEIGPFELDYESERVERIELGRGGVIEAQVRSSSGRDVAGQVVLASRGDGHPQTVRTGPDGFVRFEGATRGPWQVEVVEREIDFSEGFVLTFDTDGVFPATCVVADGKSTHVDLWMDGQACNLTGELTIDGRGAEGWIVRVSPAQRGEAITAPFQEPGRFRVSLPRAGNYQLVMTSEAGTQGMTPVLTDQVMLEVGENNWSARVRTGRLEGTVAASVHEPTLMLFHQWASGSTRVFTPIVPDAERRFLCSWVPAGKGEIVRLNLSAPMDANSPKALAIVDIEPGETATIEIP